MLISPRLELALSTISAIVSAVTIPSVVRANGSELESRHVLGHLNIVAEVQPTYSPAYSANVLYPEDVDVLVSETN